MTSNHLETSVVCKYNPQGRFSNVAEATTHQTIFSVGRELVTIKNVIFILGDVIEWNYPTSGNSKLQSTNKNKQLKSSKRSRDQELEKIAEKFNLPLNSNNLKQDQKGNEIKKRKADVRIVDDNTNASTSKVAKLKSIVNEIKGISKKIFYTL